MRAFPLRLWPMLNDMAVDTGSELTVESFHHHELLH
nr:MAG TPA: Neuronal migration protein doublecortin DOMAIN, UBIQUITIN-LIKE FOLD, MICROTUBULE.81A [Caudoviricetes sp.]